MTRWLVVWFACLVTGPVWASSDCPADQDRLACENQALKMANTSLKSVYRALEGRLDEGQRARLAHSQSTWKAYRDAECQRVRSLAEPGDSASVLQLACLSKLTVQRANALSAER